MPNWCFNKVTIRANAATRAEIREFLQGTNYYRPYNRDPNVVHPLTPNHTLFSFHNVIPQPDHILEADDPRRTSDVPYKTDEWYRWRINHWGTKWDVSDVSFVETKVSMTYAFDTAWSPPMEVIQALSRRFPNAHITITYREEGMGFRGKETFKGGQVLTQDHVQI